MSLLPFADTFAARRARFRRAVQRTRCGLAPAVALALLFALLPGSAAAQTEPRSDQAAEADRLFKEGREAAREGNASLACAKFKESQRLEPAPGTLLNIADCEEQLGQRARAYRRLIQVIAQLEADDPRLPIAKQKAAVLGKRMAWLTLRLDSSLPSATKLVLDDEELSDIGDKIAIEAGRHQLVATAPDGRTRTFPVQVEANEQREVVVTLAASEEAAGPTITPTPLPEQAEPAAGDSPTLGFIALGVGAAGIVTTLITGALALGKKSDVEDAGCKTATHTCPTQDGVDAADSGRTLSTVSTVALGVGVVGLGLGTYLVLSRGSSKNGETVLAAQGAPERVTLALRRTF